MGTLIQDLRFGLRMLCKSPGFTAVAVLTLALGIGANTAMFSVMQGVVLAPLQYVSSDRLVMVWENNPHFPRTWVSYPNFRDWQHSARSFQQMDAFLALARLAIGVVAALILTRVLSSFSVLLYGVGASDPVTFITVSVMLILVAVVACYIPTRRAMRVNPMVALRYE